MRQYLKNITLFRALFLLMLFAALGTVLYDVAFGTASSSRGTDDAGRLHAVLDAGAAEMGARLASVETVGIALIERFEEMAGGRGDAGEAGPDVSSLLSASLADAPEQIEGVGLEYETGGSRETAYRARGNRIPANRPAVYAGAHGGRHIDTAREINLGRSLVWHLLVESVDDPGGDFSAVLSVSSREDDDGSFKGEALVRVDLNWLAGTLAESERSGGCRFFCLTPGDEMLWLSGGKLRLDADFMDGGAPEAFLAARARDILSGRDKGEDFEKMDVMGTRWRIAFARPPADGLLTASGIAAAIALAVLALEVLFRGVSGGGDSRTGATLVKHAKREASGLPTRIHDLMFNYRLSNPDKERIDSELRVARQIQFSLLPPAFPEHSEWREYDLHSSLHPAREIGGDYYDFFTLGPNRLAVAVGDVSGKGMPAALYMAVCRTAFRAVARLADDPGRLLSRVNEMLVRDNRSGLYVTMACFFIDMPTGKCQYSIAGHPAPLLCRAGESGGELLDHPRETIVGMQAGVSYPVGEIWLRPGDTLLLYTDGVTEARGRSGDELEYEGLFDMFRKTAAAGSCKEIIDELESEVRAFTGDAEQVDDMTFLALRYWGPGGQRLSREPKADSLRRVVDTAGIPEPL